MQTTTTQHSRILGMESEFTPPSDRRVGILVPLLCNRVTWFNDITTVKDLCLAVCAQNPILNPKRLSIQISGKRAPFYHEIRAGSILRAEYFVPYDLETPKLCKKTKTSNLNLKIHVNTNNFHGTSSSEDEENHYNNRPSSLNRTQSSSSAESVIGACYNGNNKTNSQNQSTQIPETNHDQFYFATSKSTTHDSTGDINPKTYDNGIGFQPMNPNITDYIVITSDLDKIQAGESMETAVEASSTVASVYEKLRTQLLQRDMISPEDQIKVIWTHAQGIVHSNDKVTDVINNIPASVASLDVSIARISHHSKQPASIKSEYSTEETSPPSYLPETSLTRSASLDGSEEPETMESIPTITVPRIHPDILCLLSDIPISCNEEEADTKLQSAFKPVHVDYDLISFD